jgi:peptide/nickel transport system substrate-binding protein
LEFYVIKEGSTRYAMVKRGEVDIATTLTDVFAERVKKDPELRVDFVQTPFVWMAYPTSQWDPKSPWSDGRVRKAASLALDRKAIIDIHFPGGVALGALGIPNEGPELLDRPPDPYHPEQAKKLLSEAGYPNGFHGGKFYPYDTMYWEMGVQVANYWKAIGINVDMVRLERPAWFASRRTGKMKGGTFIDVVFPPIVSARLKYLFSPEGSYGNYPEIEALWDQYNKAVEPNVRKQLLLRIQEIISDKTMFICISNSSGAQTFGPRVKGNPIKIHKPPMWIISPMEDLELNE